VQVAGAADGVFCDGEPVAADHAEAGRDQVEQAMPETNRFHRPCRLRILLPRHPCIDG
jgi:hypothetical protein